MAIVIRCVEDIDADWTKVAPLMRAFDEHHLSFLRGESKTFDYDEVRRRTAEKLAKDKQTLLLAEDGDEAVGLAVGSIIKNPGMIEERVGLLSNFYIKERYRGTRLNWRFQRMLRDWFREKGVTTMQLSVYVANERAHRLWRLMGYAPHTETLRRSLEPSISWGGGLKRRSNEEGPGIHIRQVTDIDADWPGIQPLLHAFDEHHLQFLDGEVKDTAHESTRKRYEKGLAKGKMIIVLAEDGEEAIGMGTGSIIKDHGMLIERVGMLNGFYIDERHRGTTLILRLHRVVEDWFRAKDVTIMQRSVYAANDRTVRLWHRMGFELYIESLRKRL